MRIIIATETYFPTISGVVVFTQNLAEELTALGHTVAIFAPSRNGLFSHQKRDGIEIFSFPSLPNPFSGARKTRFVVRQYSRVAQAFHRFRPDVVHLQSPSGVPAAVQKCARKSFVPVIATHHFLIDFIMAYLKPLAFMDTLTRQALVVYLNMFYRNCDVMTCPTDTLRQTLIKSGIKAPFRVISNGIRLEQFTMAPAGRFEKVPNDLPIVLSIGRIDQDKNIGVMLEAIPKILEKVEARFVIAGTGNRAKWARAWVKANGLSKWVLFTGKISHGSTALRRLYHRASVFMITSNIETQSLVTMEAIAAGLPVVASSSGAVQELVEDGKNGFIVEPDNVKQFADRTIKILKDQKLREEMSAAGKELIQSHDLHQVVEEFLELYRGEYTHER